MLVMFGFYWFLFFIFFELVVVLVIGLDRVILYLEEGYGYGIVIIGWELGVWVFIWGNREGFGGEKDGMELIWIYFVFFVRDCK